MKKLLIVLLCTLMHGISFAQQIHGTITDAETGDTIAFASVVYKGHHIAAISDYNGQYKIDRHEGWNITFSAVGYKSRIIAVTAKTRARLNVKLKPDKQMLAEVKYMHTNVETLDMRAVTEGGRLLALYLSQVDESWEEALWN